MSDQPFGGRRVLIASQQDFAAGLFLIALGAFAWWAAGDLRIGTLRSMGPGMLPATLAVICIGLGVVLCLQALRVAGPKLEPWNWRGLLFVILGTCLFALTIRGSDITGLVERLLSALVITSALFATAIILARRTGALTGRLQSSYVQTAAFIALYGLVYLLAPVIDLSFPAIGLIVAGPLVAIVSAFASPETRWTEVLIFGAIMTAFCAALFKYALGLPIPLAPWLLGY